jgi:hypothetical protein
MKRMLAMLLGLFGLAQVHAAPPPTPRETFFVFAKIQDQVPPIERGEKYEDPLGEALEKAKLGEVTGGGTMQKKDGSIDWVGVDIELIDIGDALAFTKKKLRELAAPKGSVLEFRRDGKAVVEPIHEP